MNRRKLVIDFENEMHDINRLLFLDKKKSYYFENVSMTQLIVLREIMENSNLKVSEIADKLYVSVPAITNITDKLIGQKYIERIRSEEDRRVVRLVATESGKSLINRFTEHNYDLMEDLLTSVSNNDLEKVIDVYKKIKENHVNLSEY